MSGYANQPVYGTSNPPNSYEYEFPDQQGFQQELSFESFDDQAGLTSTPNIYGTNPYLNPSSSYAGEILYTGSGATSAGVQDFSVPPGGESYDEDEPPLLEELGINPEFILQKTLTVLNPFHTPEVAALQDTDLAGPLVFCVAFGGFLLLAGKVHFSYIYGIGVMGCLSIWALLSLMSASKVTLGTVVTVLGYCLLPMVGLSGVNVILSLQGYIGVLLTAFAILWCSLSASKLFVTALSMDHQQPLVLYPCALLYGVFALITIF